MAASTSFRISASAKQALSDRAARDRCSATSLLERLIIEGIAQLDHPGIVFRGPDKDRRAALAAGADVWEVIGRLRELDGEEEKRIAVLSEESALHPREIRTALSYAADHPDEIMDRIHRNQEAIERSERSAQRREALLA